MIRIPIKQPVFSWLQWYQNGHCRLLSISQFWFRSINLLVKYHSGPLQQWATKRCLMFKECGSFESICNRWVWFEVVSADTSIYKYIRVCCLYIHGICLNCLSCACTCVYLWCSLWYRNLYYRYIVILFLIFIHTWYLKNVCIPYVYVVVLLFLGWRHKLDWFTSSI